MDRQILTIREKLDTIIITGTIGTAMFIVLMTGCLIIVNSF